MCWFRRVPEEDGVVCDRSWFECRGGGVENVEEEEEEEEDPDQDEFPDAETEE